MLLNQIQDNTLYFGCRSATKDQHYAIEWENHVKFDGLKYRLAASRDGPEGVQRTYVQHLMEQDADHIWDVVGRRNGWIYISGCSQLRRVNGMVRFFTNSYILLRSSNKMPMAVRAAIKNAAMKIGGILDKEAADFLYSMEQSGRLFEETWS